jgi:dihydroneopterin aldolase
MTKAKLTDAWVTKYALTGGIMKVRGEVDDKATMLSWMGANSRYTSYAHGQDFHLDEASAKDRAEEMRKRKIELLKKQIKKLEALKF